MENDNTFQSFFMDDEEIKENKKLFQLLSDTIQTIKTRNLCLVKFKYDIFVTIEYIDDEYFILNISDSSIYEYDDNNQTKLSKDRILHYLEYIANLTGSGYA